VTGLLQLSLALDPGETANENGWTTIMTFRCLLLSRRLAGQIHGDGDEERVLECELSWSVVQTKSPLQDGAGTVECHLVCPMQTMDSSLVASAAGIAVCCPEPFVHRTMSTSIAFAVVQAPSQGAPLDFLRPVSCLAGGWLLLELLLSSADEEEANNDSKAGAGRIASVCESIDKIGLLSGIQSWRRTKVSNLKLLHYHKAKRAARHSSPSNKEEAVA
jgi:hypothetical protein